MRFSGSRAHIFDSGQFDAQVVDSTAIKNDTIIDADVNSAAAIKSTKLDLTAIAQDPRPSVDAGQDLGIPGKWWGKIFVSYLNLGKASTSIIPETDNVLDLGSSSRIWQTLYANSILGDAAIQSMLYGMIGGE